VNDFPSFDLEGRTALVTGAARGLGNAIALALAYAGADVALGLRDPASGVDLADQIKGMGRRVLRLPMDIRDLGTRSARRPRPPWASSARSTSS
jgi:NAD(P)-dependent dehydrogenase (short-subunit alcohol dehydrogenase family)